MTKLYCNVSWAEVDIFIDMVARHLQILGTCPGVYGIPRGGLPLAVMISHRCNISLLAAPCKGCLVVDDISDTGTTLLPYVGKDYHIITMKVRSATKVRPECFLDETSGGEWFIFPWEVKN